MQFLLLSIFKQVENIKRMYKNMTLNDYFDQIICINLNRRPDRWEESQRQFSKHKIKVTRHEAVDGNPMGWKTRSFQGKEKSIPGALGCIASHVAIYELAKKNGWKNVLIIEDDCDFIGNLNEIFEKSITTLPDPSRPTDMP